MDASAEQVTPSLAAARAPARVGLAARVTAGAVSLGCLSVLGLAAWIHPDPAGHGSHTQLGLPACPWAAMLNHPCPTCGMTTAVSHAAHGHLIRAFVTQPFGLLVALALTVAFWSGLHVAWTGSQLGAFYARMMTPRVLWALAALALASWAYKWATWPA